MRRPFLWPVKNTALMSCVLHSPYELRKKAICAFQKDLFKLMKNSFFGKAMENLRKRVDDKLIVSPDFAQANIFDDDLAAMQVHKSRLRLNRSV